MKIESFPAYVSATAIAGAAGLVIAPAQATPGSGFTPSGIVAGHFGTIDVKTESDKVGHWGMILKTKDDTDVGADRLSVAPGGYSGWHSHPSAVFVTVTHGTIVWYDGDNPVCPGHTYHTGDSFIEPAFHVHNVKNASNSSSAEFIASHINPTGTSGPAFRVDEGKPTNCNP